MSKRLILLVEDNPDDELLTLRALRKNLIMNEIVVARDGVEALDYLFCTGIYANRPSTEPPQLILLDIKLPKLNGLEILRRIKSDDRTRQLPVIILTSSNEEQDIINGYEFGADSYIRKPVDFTQFTEAIRQLKHSWLELNAPPNQIS